MDYVFTGDINQIETIQYVEPLGKSDHVVLQRDLIMETAEKKQSAEEAQLPQRRLRQDI